MAQLTQFYKDMEAAKPAEQLVYNLLSSSGYKVEDVSDIKEYRYLGDIKLVTSKGVTFFIDIKDDKRIAETGNFLFEEEVYLKDIDDFIPGDMKKHYDILAVVSQEEQKIYYLDFHIVKQKYKQGEFIRVKHPTQDTYGYLCSIGLVKR